MATHPWHQAALEELGQLRPDTDQQDEAWRALVLVGRLLSAPQSLVPDPMWLRALPHLQQVAGPSDPASLLDRLAAALEADDDPSGPLHDVLIDIDDELVVSTMSSGVSKSDELAARAQALVALWPERVLTLADFAEARLFTSRPNSVEYRLWTEVLAAPAAILAAALPGTAARAPVPARRPASAPQVAYLPDTLLRAAAASPDLTELQLGEGVWLYVSGGELRVELADRSPGATHLLLQATDRDGDDVLIERAFVVEHPGTTATVVLGDEGALEKIAEEAGRPLGSLKIRLVVSAADDS